MTTRDLQGALHDAVATSLTALHAKVDGLVAGLADLLYHTVPATTSTPASTTGVIPTVLPIAETLGEAALAAETHGIL